jgi:hypothetical protein
MNIAAKHARIGVAKQLGKLKVANLSDGVCGVGVSIGIHDDLFTGFRLKPSTLSKPSHLPNEAVLRVGLSPLVHKYMLSWLVPTLGKVFAESENWTGEWNNAGSWMPLTGNRLMVGEDPQCVSEVDPVPNERTHLTWATPRQTQGNEYLAKVHVGNSEQSLELFRLNNSRTSSGCRSFEAYQWINVYIIMLHCPIEHTGHDDQRVLNRGRAVGTGAGKLCFDLCEMRRWTATSCANHNPQDLILKRRIRSNS